MLGRKLKNWKILRSWPEELGKFVDKFGNFGLDD
jgi:hypothetical protein